MRGHTPASGVGGETSEAAGDMDSRPGCQLGGGWFVGLCSVLPFLLFPSSLSSMPFIFMSSKERKSHYWNMSFLSQPCNIFPRAPLLPAGGGCFSPPVGEGLPSGDGATAFSSAGDGAGCGSLQACPARRHAVCEPGISPGRSRLGMAVGKESQACVEEPGPGLLLHVFSVVCERRCS